MDLWKFGLEVFISLLVIIDPPGNAPIFLAIVSDRTQAVRNRLALQAVLVAFGIITLFALAGQFVLSYLGISLAAMQASGGLLLLLVSLQLLTGNSDGTEQPVTNTNVALVPLGTPLLARPGAIVATIVFVKRVDNLSMAAVLALAIVAVHIVMWIVLRSSTAVVKILKESGVTLIARIAGLLLAAIAVQMVADAVRAFIQAS